MERDLYLVFDTEANDFYEDATIAWCLVAKNMNTGQIWEFGGPEGLNPYKSEIRSLFQRAKMITCHNLIKYDLPLLYKLGILCPKDYEGAKIIDTFTISSVLNPDRKRVKGSKGPHGLDAWGIKAGRLKPEQEQWEVWEDSMFHRCREDVLINEWAFKALQEESREDEWQWSKSIKLEHDVAYIIAEQERNGWCFDKELAEKHIKYLDEVINKIDEAVVPLMPCKVVQKTPVKKLFMANTGHYTKAVCDWFGVQPEDALLDSPPIVNGLIEDEDLIKDCGVISRIEFEAPNPHADVQIKEFLLTQGWVPNEFTPKGAPKLNEESLDTVKGDAGKLLAKRKIFTARRDQLQNKKRPDEKGWISMIRPDGRISANGNPCGTPTGRFRHRQIVNVPRTTSEFGKEMREVFCVPDGYKQLGYDASGLELRCLAHYMNDPEYTDQILHGDIHTVNQEAAGLPTRDDAKTFMYALIYGAGDLKIGRIVGGNSKTGKELRYKFYKAIPALDRLLTTTKTVAGRGYLKGLDGRKIFVRSDHSSLNSLLQCAGAVAMKYSMINLENWLVMEGFKRDSKMLTDIYASTPLVTKVGDVHDEAQLQVHNDTITDTATFQGSKDQAELWVPDQRIWSAPVLVEGDKEEGTWERSYARPGELAVMAIRKAGEQLGFNCPLDAEYKIGDNWSQTH